MTAPGILKRYAEISDRLAHAAKYLDEKRIARFWRCVRKTDKCWEWVKASNSNGYPLFGIFNMKFRSSHISLIIAGRKLDREKPYALHSCDNAKCVNPDHLRWGDNIDNVRDMFQRDRHKSYKGEKNGKAKLTPDQVLDIRADTRRISEIAENYGVSSTCINLIKKRVNWKHLP